MTQHHAGRYVLNKPVFFIGFMGAGKTSVSQQIAVTYGVASIDADEYLELREDRIIADIFAEDGEEAFRDIETDVLRDLGSSFSSLDWVWRWRGNQASRKC